MSIQLIDNGDSTPDNGKQWSTKTNENVEFLDGKIDDVRTDVDTNTDDISAIQADITKVKLLGDVYNKSSWSDTSDFETYGNSSLLLNGDKIRISTSTNASFNNYVSLPKITGLNNYKISIELKIINSASSNSYGIGVGTRSVCDNTKKSFAFHYQANTGSTFGKSAFYRGDNSTFSLFNQYSNILTYSLNDILIINVEKEYDLYTFTVVNVTTKSTYTEKYTFTTDAISSPLMPNIGKFALYTLGGTFEINKLRITSNSKVNSKIMVIGDSKSIGYTASTFSSSFYSKLNDYYGDCEVSAGTSETTNDTIKKIDEIILLKPKNVILSIGSNDKRYGVSFADWSNNYDFIVSELESNNIKVFHLLQVNEPNLDFTDYNNYIKSTYSLNDIIDVGVVGISTDNVHPSQYGHDVIYSEILAQIKIN